MSGFEAQCRLCLSDVSLWPFVTGVTDAWSLNKLLSRTQLLSHVQGSLCYLLLSQSVTGTFPFLFSWRCYEHYPVYPTVPLSDIRCPAHLSPYPVVCHAPPILLTILGFITQLIHPLPAICYPVCYVYIQPFACCLILLYASKFCTAN